jgi:LPXTG-motif cell wall-anchored protein
MGRLLMKSVGRVGITAAVALASVTVVATASAAEPASDYNKPVQALIPTQVLAEQIARPEALPVVVAVSPSSAPAQAALPRTGTEAGELVLVGVGLIAAGGVIVRRTRRSTN